MEWHVTNMAASEAELPETLPSNVGQAPERLHDELGEVSMLVCSSR